MTETRSRLDRLLRPRSIAVLGGAPAEAVVRQCERMGYEGDIWPIHPNRESVAGRPAFRSLADLPVPPDAAFLGVNRALTVELVERLARTGAGGAVCYASGFREAQAELADGAALQERLVAAAGPMPILGPNTYGFINYLDGALLWPDQHGGARADRGVAILTQSSNIALNLTMQRRGLPLAYVVTLGNQAQLGLTEIAVSLLSDPRVTAIGLHIEGVRDLPALEAFAAAAREKRVPVVALKMGASEEARAAVVTHTASLAGSARVASAMFARLGIGEVRSLPALLETLKLLHTHGPLPGVRIASMSCSGGEAALMADSAVGRGVAFRSLDARDKARVKATLSEMVTVANPLDYHTFIWANGPAMERTFSAMLEAGADLTLLVLDFPREDRCSDADWAVTVDALKAAAKRTGGRAAVVATLPETLPERWAERLREAGIAPLCGIGDSYAAIEAAASIGRAWKRPAPARLPAGAQAPGPARLLDEAESKALLAANGLAVPPGAVVTSAEEAAAFAAQLGAPVALKALGIAHKSEAGAVRLNLSGDAVGEAARELLKLSPLLLVEEMVGGAVAEMIVGVSRDPEFGLALTVGAGGVLAELLEDVAVLPVPANAGEIAEAISRLKVARLLSGYRGRPKADVAALAEAASRIADFAAAHADRLDELDVNPLIVRAEGQGAVAADALVRMRG